MTVQLMELNTLQLKLIMECLFDQVNFNWYVIADRLHPIIAYIWSGNAVSVNRTLAMLCPCSLISKYA